MTNHPNTRLTKDPHNGWKAETHIPLDGSNIVLVFITMKRYGGKLSTTVQAMKTEEGSRFMSFVMFQDFNECLMTEKLARVTDKAVLNQHGYCLSLIKEVNDRCAAFYAHKAINNAPAMVL